MDFHNILYPFTALLIFILACGLGIFLTRKLHLGWNLWLVGAAGFVLSQVGHIPFNMLVVTLMERGILPKPGPQLALVFPAIFGGLSAGVWEELVRYAIMRWWARDARTWKRSVLFGAGWGGAEAILTAILALYTFAQMGILRNGDLNKLVPPEQVAAIQQVVASYWSAPAYMVLLSFFERAMALVVQISMSVLVVQAFIRRNFYWVVLALLYHALADAVSVYIAGRYGALPAEGVVAIFALISLGLIFMLRTAEPQEVDTAGSQTFQPLIIPKKVEIEETPENLESTRFNR